MDSSTKLAGVGRGNLGPAGIGHRASHRGREGEGIAPLGCSRRHRRSRHHRHRRRRLRLQVRLPLPFLFPFLFLFLSSLWESSSFPGGREKSSPPRGCEAVAATGGDGTGGRHCRRQRGRDLGGGESSPLHVLG
uniref:Uncharacterized protein n=1 Tax=Oryza brachyantha TaxID=4533 RepID=J3NC19_ORYBR